ncbi:4-hydroxy-3-methylbut-2-enyl diphosphate reductase [Streptomyces sp. 184]|uniref:4-hydroxy-3-methylbut-2-enyl diphosphate reductase n=1 Tax=Streptomyces sp. 184 TaxID=1827526 RepID=UPI0038918328
MTSKDTEPKKRIVLAEPRGFCAGVERAVGMVERALELHGPPVYVRKQIIHNQYVVDGLQNRGVVFVDSEEEVPEGAVCVFSAHGVAPEVRRNAASRELQVIDATCPLVSKVHQEAKRFATAGDTILLIGHSDHEEVEGTVGEAPEHIVVVESEEDARTLELPEGAALSYLTQTTLSIDETAGIVGILEERFPQLRGPRSDDICYASSNRQNAVKALTACTDVVLVVGSANSSNSQRMVDVARSYGTPAHLVDNAAELDPEWLGGARTVGVSSGASAPEVLVEGLLERLRQLGYGDVDTLTTTKEDITFAMPGSLA